jgi:hypothetical protein
MSQETWVSLWRYGGHCGLYMKELDGISTQTETVVCTQGIFFKFPQEHKEIGNDIVT